MSKLGFKFHLQVRSNFYEKFLWVVFFIVESEAILARTVSHEFA